MTLGDVTMYNEEKYDFRALVKAIKEARESKGLTREKLGELFDLAPRYIMSIENKGQHPSFQVFYELASFFHISVDQFFFPEEAPGKTSRRRRIDSLLDELDDTELIVMEATAKGIKEAKVAKENE